MKALMASFLLMSPMLTQAGDDSLPPLLEQLRLDDAYISSAAAESPPVEVESIFWFGCSYCRQLAPLLDGWVSENPQAVFAAVPAPLSEPMAGHARAYHSMKVLGAYPVLRDKAYSMVTLSPQSALANGESFAAFMRDNGFDEAYSREFFFSEYVTEAVRKDFYRLKGYNLTVAPAIIVDGQYLITGSSAGGIPEMVDQLDEVFTYLTEKKAMRGQE